MYRVMSAALRWHRREVGKDALTAARDLGADAPRHIVSDGDRAIESAIDMAYGRDTPHQLCQFHLLRECARNIGIVGLSEAKALRCLVRTIWSMRGSMPVG